jgi:citrate lyase subunit beta/citryl-CoA lyase
MLALAHEAEQNGAGVAVKNEKFIGPPMVKMAKGILNKQKLISSKSSC